jgi:hypothetical protein
MEWPSLAPSPQGSIREIQSSRYPQGLDIQVTARPAGSGYENSKDT